MHGSQYGKIPSFPYLGRYGLFYCLVRKLLQKRFSLYSTYCLVLGAIVSFTIKSPRIRMEEEILSVISNGGTNVIVEASDSNSSSLPFHGSKRTKQGISVSSGRFKGVVPQQNGHWGAQIYANHQRIWLGTYKSETEAAMAYDSAAIKLRSGDNHRNFPWTNLTIQEPNFQSFFSTETVVNMIKDGSYPSKFAEFLKTESQRGETEVLSLDQVGVHRNGRFMCRLLFQKELTPSDVGKLNRLVIPKKYATKHFPPISESAEENEVGGAAADMQLVFYDRLMRLWKFRYCYWRSSQSYVFTRGWNRFVKDKELNENDIVTFYLCEYGQGTKEGRTFCMIDVAYDRNTDGRDANNGSFVEGPNRYVGLQIELQQDLKQNIGYNKHERKSQEEEESVGTEPALEGQKKGLRLFGVQIG